ncbi:hypothetical protein NWUPM366V_131 [Escherichia phage vB_EcoM_366V_SA_NWU]|nr:hypothetical protein NWUPM12A_152 [Escherichia phage vB_EcoM_12A_SA_NWU]WIL79706.1 hypothetical protein NWUPM366V_131 [Escherichia phage vB_EcoM_366V_SA_NWU]
MRSIPISSAWQHSSRYRLLTGRHSCRSGQNRGRTGPIQIFLADSSGLCGKSQPLRRRGGVCQENCRSIKKFTWCMKRSSGKAGIMG